MGLLAVRQYVWSCVILQVSKNYVAASSRLLQPSPVREEVFNGKDVILLTGMSFYSGTNNLKLECSVILGP